MDEPLVLSVSDFVGILNQTLEYAYPSVSIVGELANFRISKNKWVYFDLKDKHASVKFFGTIYQLSGPLEDGLMIQVRGVPRLHQLYGFSVNVQFMQPVGEGSLKKAAALLEAKLTAEGLFDTERKRRLPYPPQKIGLITSGESAAYHDFIKVLAERWGGIDITFVDVQVQGESAPGQIVAGIEQLNTHEGIEAIIITRGGGSAEDLAAFNSETVTRAVAASRVPTIVAIGHEVDISLAELAADQRASTPSNAAQLLTPDKHQALEQLSVSKGQLNQLLLQSIKVAYVKLKERTTDMRRNLKELLDEAARYVHLRRQLLEALSPAAALRRGYAIIRTSKGVIRVAEGLNPNDIIYIAMQDGSIKASVKEVTID